MIIQKIVIKHNLDTQKDVDSVLKTLSDMEDSFLPEITVEGVEDIANRLKDKERKKLDLLLDRYKKEKREQAREKIFKEVLTELKDQLDGQEKPLVLKILHDIKNFFKFKTKEVELEKRHEEKEQEKEQEQKEEKEQEKLDELAEQEEKEQKKEDRKNKLDQKKKDRSEKRNRRQKNLKKFIKKTSLQEESLVNPKIANIIRMYLIETGDEYGDL